MGILNHAKTAFQIVSLELFFSFIARDTVKEKEKDEKFLGSFKDFWKSINTLLEAEKKEVVKSNYIFFTFKH